MVSLHDFGALLVHGQVQSIVAAVLDIVPPLIPPPVWNNMPLPCAPMITGVSEHCFMRLLEYAFLHVGQGTIASVSTCPYFSLCGHMDCSLKAPCSTQSLWPILSSLM